MTTELSKPENYTRKKDPNINEDSLNQELANIISDRILTTIYRLFPEVDNRDAHLTEEMLIQALRMLKLEDKLLSDEIPQIVELILDKHRKN